MQKIENLEPPVHERTDLLIIQSLMSGCSPQIKTSCALLPPTTTIQQPN